MSYAAEALERCDGCDDMQPGVRTYQHMTVDGWSTVRYCRWCEEAAAMNWTGETLALRYDPYSSGCEPHDHREDR